MNGQQLYLPLLEQGLAQWELVLDRHTQERLCAYLAALAEKNRVMDLTAVTDPEGMVRRHLLDSLAPLKLGLLSALPPQAALVDVGTGAGLPGVPLAVALPQLAVTLLDSHKKRLDFLAEVLRGLPLPNARTALGRAEQLAHEPALRARFDVVTARAVAALPALCEYCLPFARVGGMFLPYKGGDLRQELEASESAIRELGGQLEGLHSYRVPGEEATRSLPVIRKVKETPKRFPRGNSQIKAKPL